MASQPWSRNSEEGLLKGADRHLMAVAVMQKTTTGTMRIGAKIMMRITMRTRMKATAIIPAISKAAKTRTTRTTRTRTMMKTRTMTKKRRISDPIAAGMRKKTGMTAAEEVRGVTTEEEALPIGTGKTSDVSPAKAVAQLIGMAEVRVRAAGVQGSTAIPAEIRRHPAAMGDRGKEGMPRGILRVDRVDHPGGVPPEITARGIRVGGVRLMGIPVMDIRVMGIPANPVIPADNSAAGQEDPGTEAVPATGRIAAKQALFT